jgi:sugar-specific transcriptional regulator TrmB
MPKDIAQLLNQVGLLPSESKVYLSALELGPSTVQLIAAKAKISRTAAYEAVELLTKRGLISSSLSGKRKLFAAEDPHRIVSYLKEEQQKFSTTLADIERQVEALHLLAGGIKPTVKVYEGDEAMHAYFDNIAQAKPTVFDEISNLDDVYQYLPSKKIQAARKAYDWSGIKRMRLLHFGELRNPRPGVEFCRLTDRFGEFHGNITIYGDYVALVTYVGRPVVVIIESKNMADTMRVLFNAAWNTCAANH